MAQIRIGMKKKHCCENMEMATNLDCNSHQEAWNCPDTLISFIPKFDEYGIIIRDGGSSVLGISFCPWCGKKLPDSKRDEWFDKLEELGFDDPTEQSIPEQFHTDEWYM